MRKSVIILFVLLFLTGFVLAVDSNKKIDSEVIEKVQEEGVVEVFIKIKNETASRVSDIGQSDIRDTIEVKHDFGDIVSAIVTEEELAVLEEDASVESIEVVGTKKIFLTESVPLINGTVSWATKIDGVNLTGAGETVCVLDTGVDFMHPDLQGKNLTCLIDCVDASCVADCSATDGHGHGTHVAGIVAANGAIKGVAPDANLIGIKVCDDGGSCSDSDVLSGIDWCVNNAETYNISVISLSLGGEILYSSYCDSNDIQYRNRANNAVAKNISFVVATGNDASATGIASPACLTNATSVGMTYDANVGGVTWGGGVCTDSSTFVDMVACASNRNSITDLFAPGYAINSTWTNDGYYVAGGTSMATPHVSGAIAILREYKRLEGISNQTPQEYEDALNLTGVLIDDTSESGLNFSRIDIYSAILELDETVPVVNLTNPDESEIVAPNSIVTFNCSAEDVLQLANLTLNVWNSTGELINETSVIASSNSVNLSVDINLSVDEYEWNCLAYDDNYNYAFFESNYSVIANVIVVDLISPTIVHYDSSNETNFTCISSIGNGHALSNVTFYLWNSTNGLIYNETRNISGSTNTTVFNYTFSEEQEYDWNCLAYDNLSNFAIENNNYSFIFDATTPALSDVSPASGHSVTGAQSITFSYNATDLNLDNCSLLVDSSVTLTNDSINQSITNSFTDSFSVGSYIWEITCYDLAGNEISSGEKSLIVNAEPTPSGSRRSSPSGSEPVIPFVTTSEMEKGTSKYVSRGGQINFVAAYENHTLVVDSILEDRIFITLESDPVKLILIKNQMQKINLNDDEYYDLELLYLGEAYSRATVFLRAIHEEIPVKYIFSGDAPQSSVAKKIEKPRNIIWALIDIFRDDDGWNVSFIVILCVFLIAAILYFTLRKNILKNCINLEGKVRGKKSYKRKKKL